MAERYALEFHHPVNRATTTLAAKAMPQVLGWRHHQAGGVVVMEEATPSKVLAGFTQLNARRLHQALHCDFIFQPLDFGIGDACHGEGTFQTRRWAKTCQCSFGVLF